jgi:hypothetical protein
MEYQDPPLLKQPGTMQRSSDELDRLKLIIRQAGGLQRLASQIESMLALIDAAGGLQKLEELITAAQNQQQDYAELVAAVEAPNGLKAKAAKYDQLRQVFDDVLGKETLDHNSVYRY